MKFCPNVIKIFEDYINTQKINYSSVRSVKIPYNDKDITGYVHTLDSGNALMITDNLVPYLITMEFVEGYDLKTGDKIQAKADYSARYERFMVEQISDVVKVDYDTTPAVRSTRTFTLHDRTVKLGTSIVQDIGIEQDFYEQIDYLMEHTPAGASKIILAFDGRQENYPTDHEIFLTNTSQNTRDKLTICLLAFFRAKEIASTGKDVILIVDSLDKMFTVFNNCLQTTGSIETNIVSALAMMDYESILRSSKCLTTKGTLTIIGLHRQGLTYEQKYVTDRLRQIFDSIIITK